MPKRHGLNIRPEPISQLMVSSCPALYVGALDERRLQFFRERFESLRADQQHGGGATDGGPHLPPFHYGSHYSSAGIVRGSQRLPRS